MLVTEKAQELGSALRETEEATILRAAEINIDNNPESRQLIQEFHQSFQKIKSAQEAGEEVDGDVMENFNRIQEKVKTDENIQAYFSAQQRFHELLQQVNAIINQVLSGGSCSSDCCDSCSGCS
jgi:cell fate (sporulation/competence/biofilm development) regulator YlbF (YheA/YmcA/DUF963 family)